MSDKMLQRTVMDELAWDPSINSAHIGVAASDGVVTLTGKVDSYAAKSAAERVTGRLFGVKAVVEQLDVKYAGDTSPDDGEIASYALRVLSWDVDVPRNSVLVKVEKGWVTLTGELDWNYQRTAAERDVRKLYGVKGVTNQIKIKSRVASADVREKIKAALTRNAQIEANNVNVATSGTNVTLSGTIPRWSDRFLIEETAWSAPGVTEVEDLLHVA